MRLRLLREKVTDKSTIGRLFINDRLYCFTLEDPVREKYVDGHWEWKPEYKIKGKTAIPSGKYPVEVTYSTRFRRELPLLRDVPDFKGVRIHKGNWPEDTEGCILPGRIPGVDAVYESAKVFDPLYSRLLIDQDRGVESSIEIINTEGLIQRGND